ncbi:protease complex subunit PrcB family protein [Streptomyces sp. TRM66268-LWL]|uniref:Protease complex subunit PrcB family protein n=1 Tax=Streptomyces polyasparticus TaxID=2767826 RepID=A0ABR7SJV4_9ACTN|nr:protease complex subunit PrcB family protein [Streptomyces polyasparticus]MBC9715771.1 protease complex subunit PrcB family protein [Streptomyces polyasparticus]
MDDRSLAGDEPEHEIAFRTLVCVVWSRVQEAVALDVRTESAWADLWRRATGNQSASAPAPGVDWSRDFVLFVATGERPSTGYRVEIRRVVRRGRVMHVYVVESVPPPGAVTGCAITNPLHAVAVPWAPDGVGFRFHMEREASGYGAETDGPAE